MIRTRVGDDVIYGEAPGLLPISWTGSPGQAAGVLAQLGDPPVRDSDVLAPLVETIGPRRGLPGYDTPELERLLGAVVGTALGSHAQGFGVRTPTRWSHWSRCVGPGGAGDGA